MQMRDFATSLRKAFIQNNNDAKREVAKRYLGDRYVLHPSQRIQRLSEPLKR